MTLPAAFASVAELKAQARIDGNSEDTLLQLYLDGALEALETSLNKHIVLTSTQSPKREVVYDNSLKIAHLQLAAEQYKNREATSDKQFNELPSSILKIVEEKRTWFGGSRGD